MRPVEIAYKERGYAGVAEFLKNNCTVMCDEVLSMAAAQNDLPTVQLLLPYSNPLNNNSMPLRRAAIRGHYDMVAFLIPISEPSALKSAALLRAVENHDLKMVQLLLPHCNPRTRRSEFLLRCVYNDLKDIAKVLWPLSDVEMVRKFFFKDDSDHARLQLTKMEHWEAEFQKIRLQQELLKIAPKTGRTSKL